MTDVRRGQSPDTLDRETFGERFRGNFADPAFDAEQDALVRIEEIAWLGYSKGRKAPHTHKAGPGYADPNYDLSDEWRANADRIQHLQDRWNDAATPSRVLVVCGSDRNDGTCPGEMSKSFRLARLAEDAVQQAGIDTDFLDLSWQSSEYGLRIHPCKGCVSTAMPLCHWPCSCYPNHGLNQVNDWMGEIYERWVQAHAVLIVTATYWYQSPSALKLMIDRLVCADGGNPDPTSTGGKDPAEAKALELAGWDYPQHLAGRAYGLIVHGDVAGVEGQRRALSDWLDWMGLVDAGSAARLDRYIGYYAPYATSHDALDDDRDLQQEARNVGTAVAHAVGELRAGRLQAVQCQPKRPRPK